MKKIAACILALIAVSASADDASIPAPAPTTPQVDSSPAYAPLTESERQQKHAAVQELRTRASQMRNAIEKEYAETQKVCWNKFLVSRCQDQAKVKRREALEEVRRLEAQARDTERELHRREAADREAKRDAEQPLRDAKALERAEKNRQERDAAKAKVAEKQTQAR